MSTTAASGSASAILAAAGVEEDWSYYGPFVGDRERAVLTVCMRIQHAWAVNDPDRFAALFTENGSLLMRDEQLASRAEIHAHMAAGFRGPYQGARVKGWPVSVTFLTDDVALVITEGGIIMAGESDLAPERLIRATWVIVRQGDDWRLMSHQSSPVRG